MNKLILTLSVLLLGTLNAMFCSFAIAEDVPGAPPTTDLQQKVTQLQQMMAQTNQGTPALPGGGQPTPDVSAMPTAPTNPNPTNNNVVTPTLPQAAIGQNQNLPAATLPETTNNIQQEAIPKKDTVYDKAFLETVNQLVPMTPEQIAKLREVFDASQQASSLPSEIPQKPTTTSLQVNLSPQATPPVIRLGTGYITSMVFMDSTGQPWPIEAYSIGDPTSFNIQWDKKGNTLLVQSAKFYKRSNLAVILKELNTPVMLTLLTGQGAVDYRVDLRIPGIGPNAMFVQNGLPDAANPILLDVLNGVPPKGSKELKVSGGDCKAWVLGSKLYLRTSLDVISPAWQAIMSSIDGTHAYELQVAPVILALQHGKDKVLTLTVEGME